jgi:ethanolamine utilization protein EutN
MYLGRVVGRVWCTVKNPEMEGQRFLLVQPITPDLQASGRRIVCTDAMGAGSGEIVYWVRSREAAMPFLPREVATDATIIAIVDSIHLKEPAKPAPQADSPTPKSRRRKAC